jgi:hypothetical protein
MFFPNLFCLLLSVGTFTSDFKDKSHKEVIKQQKSRFFANDGRIRIRTNNYGSGSWRPKKYMDPMDPHPAPEQCL